MDSNEWKKNQRKPLGCWVSKNCTGDEEKTFGCVVGFVRIYWSTIAAGLAWNGLDNLNSPAIQNVHLAFVHLAHRPSQCALMLSVTKSQLNNTMSQHGYDVVQTQWTPHRWTQNAPKRMFASIWPFHLQVPLGNRTPMVRCQATIQRSKLHPLNISGYRRRVKATLWFRFDSRTTLMICEWFFGNRTALADPCDGWFERDWFFSLFSFSCVERRITRVTATNFPLTDAD